MLSDDERALLALVQDEGPPGYPVAKLAGKWTWEYRSLKAPRMYATKADAVKQLERLLEVLRDAERVENERRYNG